MKNKITLPEQTQNNNSPKDNKEFEFSFKSTENISPIKNHEEPNQD